jgi:hypothetical protein
MANRFGGARSRPKSKPGCWCRLRWLSVQLLFEFIDQFLIVGLDAKISVPSYWTVFSVFARDLIFQRRE